MNGIPEELRQLIILLGFLLPPLVAIFKGWLGLSKKAASVAVIIICVIFAVLGAALTGQIVVGDAILVILWEIVDAAVWILLLAYGFYKIIYQALGLDEWIVFRFGGKPDG